MNQFSKEENDFMDTNDRKAMDEFLEYINQNKIISPNSNIIEITNSDKQKYVFQKVGEKYVEVEKNGNFINPNFKEEKLTTAYKKRKKIKTRKGKIISPNVLKILVPATLIAMSLLKMSNHTNTTNENLNEIEILEVLPENEIKSNEISPKMDILEDYIETEETESTNEIVITQTTSVEVQQNESMMKREQTDELFGNIINYYTSRYGIPNSIGKAIISQERSSENHKNLGQLTRKICGEKIVIPVIGQNIDELEKIYVVRDEPKKENYETLESYREQLDIYKNQLKESVKLSKEGYDIYSFHDLIQDPEKNLHISMAYFVHCIYKCDMNVSQGIRAYNSGYTVARKANDMEIASGKIKIGDSDYNKHVFAHLYPNEVQDMVWHLKSMPKLSEVEKKDMTSEQILEKERELLKSSPSITINMTFSNIKELDYAKENGYHL